MVQLKYLINVWRALEMPFINCEINLQLKWSDKCPLVASTARNQEPKFKITDANFYVWVGTLSTQVNVKLHKLLE